MFGFWQDLSVKERKDMYDHADEQGIDRDRIIVGGESAGGGLAAAVCLYSRDKGEVPVTFQIPLYPMLDSEDTDSSRDNHAHGWNTKKNHWGWSLYNRVTADNGVTRYYF